MSTCQWCTLGGSDTTEFLKSYASKRLSPEDLEGSNDDLCYCLECVVEYHKAREKLPKLHEVLWELETSRLIAHIEKSMQEESGEDDELFIVDENGETQLPGYVGQDFENNLRVPLLEILKYPYLLLHERVSELCVEVLCKMEQNHRSFQVFDKYPGIYLFLVHPNEVIRRWAILTARNLGKVDRDDYYDLQEVLTCLFKVNELGHFEGPDIYRSSMIEKGKLIHLPSHLYDSTNYKNYWLGICMLLTVLEEQAMDSLLLGPDKQNDFLQSILDTMEKGGADDSTDPFWPALHCFMVILDQLGSKVWGQLIDPVQAFQTIINSPSYMNEIKNIRARFQRLKPEPDLDDDDMVTCSQMVYNYNTEKPQKDTSWKTAICPDYCPSLYEDIQALSNLLQSNIGKDMRVHDSTFMWFIPFVQSLTDLKGLGAAYIAEVIHYLCLEIKNILNERIQQCDKISEFFLLILVSIIELHRNKKCLHLLWICSQEWVEAVVRCAKLPSIAFTPRTEKTSVYSVRSSSSLQASTSVQHACVQLIRSLLREGYQIGQNAVCKQYLDKLNLLLRGSLSLGWQLNVQETHELQLCLRQVIKSIRDRMLKPFAPVGSNADSPVPRTVSIKQEKSDRGYGYKMSVDGSDGLPSPLAVVSEEGGGEDCQESPFFRRKTTWEEEPLSSRSLNSTGGLLLHIKKEISDSTAQEYGCKQNSLAAKLSEKVQENRNRDLVAGKCSMDNQGFNPSTHRSDCRGGTELENKCAAGPVTPAQLAAQTHIGSPEHVCSSDVKESGVSSSSSSKFRIDVHRIMDLKNKIQKVEWFSKESCPAKPHDLKNSGLSKNDLGLQKNEDDDVLLLGISNTLAKRGSTEEKSSSLLKSVVKMETDMQTSDQEQANLSDLAQSDCKGQFSKAFCMDKTSANIRVPSSSENKRDVCNPPSQIRPLSVKCESSDRLYEFSEYFKKESTSVMKKEEDVAEVVSEDAVTDSEVDRELSKLSLVAYAKSVNFPLDSSQESSVHQDVRGIKRKVKGALRSSSDCQSTKSPCEARGRNNQVIVISDSSDEETNVTDKEERETTSENVCPGQQPSTSSCVSESKSPSSSSSLEGCESQYFEFETDDDVFSVWQDTQAYCVEATQEYKQDSGSTSSKASSSNDLLKDHTNDEDYVNIETMEEKANIIEEQVEKPSSTKEVTNSALQESVSKGDSKDPLENLTDAGAVAEDLTLDSKLTEPRASTSHISLASKLALKKSSTSPLKTIAKSKVAKAIQRSPKKPLALKTAQNKKLLQTTTKYSQSVRSMPAVVPPRKVRQCPAPESTVEKLGLKKAPRKAFELSQRSLDSIVQLRSHGKAAGRVCVPQKRKTKQIAAQSLSIRHNRKFLACQDRQYLRQTRPQKSIRVKNSVGGSESRNTKVSRVDAKAWKQKLGSSELASVEGSTCNQEEKKRMETVGPSTSKRKFGSVSVEEETHVSKEPCSSHVSRKSEVNNNGIVPPVTEDSDLSCAALVGDDEEEPFGKGCMVQPKCEKTDSKDNECKPNEDSDDDDGMFLTQSDPVDMDLCSQEDTAIVSATPEEMDSAESLQQNKSSAVSKCKYTDCMEEVEKPGDYCGEHAVISSGGDHLFVKPSLPPPKTSKPSTTKIFSSASSPRNAAFSRDLEVGNKLPLPSKSKVNAAKQAVLRPPRAKAVPAGNQTCPPPRSSSTPQPSSYDNVLRSLNRQNDNTSSAFGRPARQTYSSFLGAQQRDHSIFVNEVLKWTYEMFANFSQFGPPSNLVHSVVASVPVQFQGYDEYFNTFFPLMMLNAFETLAQEWIDNQKVNEKNYYLLHLKSFSADSNTAKFEARFREADLARQLNPKEDDLVFLVVQKRRDPFREESEMENQTVRHVGLVTRFCRAFGCSTRKKEQHTACELYVQTRGNLSFFINNQVKCVVVGSLVTTHRTFKALLLLSRSPLAKPIINPSHSNFCPRDLPVSSETVSNRNSPKSYRSKYNEDQQRAIETAYAMVNQNPVLPKVCLIHGPPGTGKSKTIVGLLSRILRKNTRNEETTRRSNSRMKPNRFLVCAPSNAAVDELMKKIIVAFKEKCQNRKEPLGNCGDIKLVRLGAERAINSEVRGFSLDKQVEHRMKRTTTDFEQDLQKKKEAIDQRLDMLIRQRAMNKYEKRETQMINDEFNRLSKEREQIASQLKEVRGHSQKVQADIILESDIICCTLSTSGGGLLESTFSRQGLAPFSCVIVDEVRQSCEVETLIPLIHRCNKLVLVGDPRQLPPTVKSVKAQEYGYDQSLMARLHRHLEEQVRMKVLRSLPVVQLTVQYRMHPDICLFPSNYVYGRTLKTDKATEENRCSSEWPFQPYLIFDVGDGHEERDNDSFSNPQEVKLVMELIRTIKEKRKDLGLRRIGIITPYSAQKKKIQEQLDKVFKNNSPGEVDTVDAFQGREKDCIIVTCVRANNSKGSIGFLASLQRLNVTITRARFSLFILGRLETLMENKDWNELIQDAHKRGAIIKTSERSYRKDAVKILKLK
ncbi:SETX helicase, partial [Rhinopomastus cyanomelas]|nr:SETX helicase [Rhinopomastus cyanomelas]